MSIRRSCISKSQNLENNSDVFFKILITMEYYLTIKRNKLSVESGLHSSPLPCTRMPIELVEPEFALGIAPVAWLSCCSDIAGEPDVNTGGTGVGKGCMRPAIHFFSVSREFTISQLKVKKTEKKTQKKAPQILLCL